MSTIGAGKSRPSYLKVPPNLVRLSLSSGSLLRVGVFALSQRPMASFSLLVCLSLSLSYSVNIVPHQWQWLASERFNRVHRERERVLQCLHIWAMLMCFHRTFVYLRGNDLLILGFSNEPHNAIRMATKNASALFVALLAKTGANEDYLSSKSL